MDLVRRKLNSLGNYPIYEALKWSFQSTGARWLHGTVPCATASAGTSTPAQTSSPRSWALHLQSWPWCFLLTSITGFMGRKSANRD